MEYLLPYSCMVIVPHIMVGLERMLDYRGVGLVRLDRRWVLILTTRSIQLHWTMYIPSGSNIRHVNTHSLSWILHMYTCVFGSDVACCIGITIFEGNKCTQTNN